MLIGKMDKMNAKWAAYNWRFGAGTLSASGESAVDNEIVNEILSVRKGLKKEKYADSKFEKNRKGVSKPTEKSD